MTTNRPILYKHDAAELRRQIADDLAQTIQWQAQQDGAGQGLIELFGRLAEITISRLNRVPEQHLLAFLNEGGIDQLPPRAASTQIAFLPEKDGRPAIAVPAGTQVATRPTEGQPEIIFEVAREFQVTPTGLERCITLDQRTYGDRTAQANTGSPGSFAAFQGDTVRERILYLRHDSLLAFPDAATREQAAVGLIVEMEPTASPALGNWLLDWRYWDGQGWTSLLAGGASVQDGTDGLRHSGEVWFTQLPEFGRTEVNGREGCWIGCWLVPEAEQVTLPTIRSIRIAREIDVADEMVAVNAALTGTQAGAAFAPVKPEDAFYPFGQRPALMDALYLRVDEAFSKPGATVEIRMDLQGLHAVPDDISELEKLAVDWEYFGAEGWERLGSSRWGCPMLEFLDRNDPLIQDVHVVAREPQSYVLQIDLPDDYSGEPPSSLPGSTLRYHTWTARPYAEMPLPAGCESLPESIIQRGRGYVSERLGFRDTTCALTAGGPGLVSFLVPAGSANDPPFATTEVNGQAGYWIRARIVSGSYDVPRPKTGGLLGRLVMGDLPPLPPEPFPPLVRALEVHYTDYRAVDPPQPLQQCWSQVDQQWRRHTDGQPFAPFTSPVEHRALYLGFNPLDPELAMARPAFPPETWVELYFDVAETGDDLMRSALLWEYWNGAHWRRLAMVDATLGLQRRGYLGFFGPADHQPSTEFGTCACWLRTYPLEAASQPGLAQDGSAGGLAWMPRLNAIRLNTVPAANAETIAGEVLGSSNGEKNQTFKLSRAPVLHDLAIEVQEPGEQSDQPGAIWIAWHRVTSFLACGPGSRCFVLDAVSGMISFGDGSRGMIPPAGRNNIRARLYRTHAGAAGNLAPGRVTILRNPKDALSEIHLVSNFEPASGGSDAEEAQDVIQRGPYTLKNRQRAVAKEDFEWLARDIDGARRVFCLPARMPDGTTRAGWVTVVVVPNPAQAEAGSAGRPVPSPELLRQVRAHLEQRGLANLARPEVIPGTTLLSTGMPDQDQIHVTGPGFVEVKVSAAVVPRDPARADAVRTDILHRLREFLDPLGGGPDRLGWEPGRDVYISEIAAEIEQVAGVDAVAALTLLTPARQEQLALVGSGAALPWDMPAGSEVSTFDEHVRLNLGVSLSRDRPLQQIMAFGLNAGDQVHFVATGGESGHEVRVARRLVDLFKITFDRPIAFADSAALAMWLEDLGAAPGLASVDGRFRLDIPVMGRNAQLDTSTDEATGRVNLAAVRVIGLQPDHRLSVGDQVGIAGAAGSSLPETRSVGHWAHDGFWVIFDLPVDFASEEAFEDWQARLGEAPVLASRSRHIQLPITGYDRTADATGRVHLAGVVVRGLMAGEPASLTHATHRHRRVDFIPVQQVYPWVDQERVFVPADYLVCSADHDIRMVLETEHARQATEPG